MLIPTLNENLINRRLTTYSGKVFVYNQVVSTQIQAKKLWQESFRPLTVVANGQTGGYGRHGRSFYSPADTGLYFSIALPLQSKIASAKIGLLTTGMAVVVGNALQKQYPHDTFTYKWVNDIYLNGKKVCGIIAELVEHNHQQAIIIGVGLNLMTTTFPPSLVNKAQSIDATNTVDRNHLLATILDSTVDFFAHYQTGFFLPVYRKNSLILGKQVTIRCGQQLITGVASAIDDQGRLVVTDQAGELHQFASGEVTKVII